MKSDWYVEKEIKDYQAGEQMRRYDAMLAKKPDGSLMRANAVGLEHCRYDYEGRFEGRSFSTMLLVTGVEGRQAERKIGLSTMFYRIDRQIGISESNIIPLIDFLKLDVTAGLNALNSRTECFTFVRGGWPRWEEFQSLVPFEELP